jgi:hypothetical protein
VSDPGDLEPEVPFAGENDAADEDEDDVLDELREMPVGTNDPNIVGDAGPLDVPPGSDPPEGLER